MIVAKALTNPRIHVLLFLALGFAATVAPAQSGAADAGGVTLITLYSFDSTHQYPRAGLVQATNGDLYGTTYGANVSRGISGGTVFKITPSGALTSLYSFCAQSGCADGAYPDATLVQATNGDFYGTTQYGGVGASCPNEPGCGTVFKMTPTGTLTTLYSFCTQTACADGGQPSAGLVQAASGDLYGTTYLGGTYGDGTVFKITPSGTLTTLHSFDSTDGANPAAGLVQAVDGNLYGTTLGGTGGTVFKMTPAGTLTTLHSFCSQAGCPDGNTPFAGLVQASDGDFYGTTFGGGSKDAGTVFKITPNGALTTLYNFCSQSKCADGGNPEAGLVQATDGNLYGTTSGGGTYDKGTVFNITPSGMLTTLYSFCQAMAGCGTFPSAGLAQDTNGTFYGTTWEGGANYYYGTVFSLSVGLGAFVETQPSAGIVGAAVKILGSDLTGTTSVTFNGTAATFTVVSAREVTTTVPSGATSGKVQAITPSGTLTSNVSFEVAP
jgi:uncharacterized repeat protein (TIGR03803 family)